MVLALVMVMAATHCCANPLPAQDLVTSKDTGSARKLLSKHESYCYWEGKQYNPGTMWDGWQCCNGDWKKGGCGYDGRKLLGSYCYWEGKQYSQDTMWDGYQCCDGEWKKGGCGYGGRKLLGTYCYWEGKQYNPGTMWDGWQCCDGEWKKGGCGYGGRKLA